MFTKEYYLHFMADPWQRGIKRKGFTAKVVLLVTEGIPELLVQSSFCSKKDQFCKKTGRSVAESKPQDKIKPSCLPKYLNHCVATCFKDSRLMGFWEPRFDRLLKRIMRDAGI